MDVVSLVEVGTWKGMGSTLLIANSLVGRDDVVAVSFEANRDFYRIAEKNLSDFERPQLVWGSIVEPGELDESGLTEEESVWLREDLAALEIAPLARFALPDRIDFLLLDGGEFSSWAEFMYLLPRLTRFVLLDDTLVRKNRRVDEFLHRSAEWCLLDWGADRNGWAVWLRLGER